MTIQETILSDLERAVKNKDISNRENLKVIFSELQRQKTKILTDDTTIYILQTLKGWEEDRLIKCDVKEGGSRYLDILNNYIPESMQVKELNENAIKEWIIKNIDFSKYKNKFASIKLIKSNLGPGADGSLIHKIIEEM